MTRVDPCALLAIPSGATELVVIAGHDRDDQLATACRQRDLATLALAPIARELAVDAIADHLVATLEAVRESQLAPDLAVGLFGIGDAGAAAVIAAARRPKLINVVAALGSDLELADTALAALRVPTLFIVGSSDTEGIRHHRDAARGMIRRPALSVIPGANRGFEQPGALAEAAATAATWFADRLRVATPTGRVHVVSS